MRFLKPAITVWAYAVTASHGLRAQDRSRTQMVRNARSGAGKLSRGWSSLRMSTPDPRPPSPRHRRRLAYFPPISHRPQFPAPNCTPSHRYSTNAEQQAATERCVSVLSADTQVIVCLFEDDAGRAEDDRTGLSCASRQAALAKQCRNRCAHWAFGSNNCNNRDTDWQTAFGDFDDSSAQIFGSARVALCGHVNDSVFTSLDKSKGYRQRFSPFTLLLP